MPTNSENVLDISNMEDFDNITALRIKELRESKNWSLRQFGDALHVTKSTIFRWERNELKTLKVDKVKEIADLFDVNPLWIMGFDVPKKKEPAINAKLREEINGMLRDLDTEQLTKIKKMIEVLL